MELRGGRGEGEREGKKEKEGERVSRTWKEGREGGNYFIPLLQLVIDKKLLQLLQVFNKTSSLIRCKMENIY